MACNSQKNHHEEPVMGNTRLHTTFHPFLLRLEFATGLANVCRSSSSERVVALLLLAVNIERLTRNRHGYSNRYPHVRYFVEDVMLPGDHGSLSMKQKDQRQTCVL